MNKTIHLEPQQVADFLKELSGYSGKKFKAVITTSVFIPATAGLWDGGSRDTYFLIHLGTRRRHDVFQFQHESPWAHERTSVDLPIMENCVIVKHTHFQGKDLGLTFYVRPENVATMLPAPTRVFMTPNQQQVLNIVGAYKSSYRREQAQRQGIRLADYDSIIGELKNLGLLDSRGAITVKGKNIRNERY